jgi:hypothetical protein
MSSADLFFHWLILMERRRTQCMTGQRQPCLSAGHAAVSFSVEIALERRDHGAAQMRTKCVQMEDVRPQKQNEEKMGANLVCSDMQRGRKGPGQKRAWFRFRSQTTSIMGQLLQGGCGEDIVGSVEDCCRKRARPAASSQAVGGSHTCSPLECEIHGCRDEWLLCQW